VPFARRLSPNEESLTPLGYGCQFLKPFAERQCLKKVAMMPERVLERAQCT
jgi:hypothetical protein